MKIKLDENLPAKLALSLAHLGHDVDTTTDEGFRGGPDEQVWIGAQKAERFLITQDLDFSDIRKFKPGSHHGLLLIRLREPGRKALVERIEDIFQNEDVSNWSGLFIIATERKIRIRGLKSKA